MRSLEHPEGTKLPALERNILKFRAFEMMLSFFYAEDLKRFLTSTVEVSDRFRTKKRFKPGTKFNYAMAADFFLKEGHLSKAERHELKTLIDFRNDIAHEPHTLTFDIGRSNFIRKLLEHKIETPKYDYGKLKRLKWYRRALPERFGKHFGLAMSSDRLFFEAAEKTYEAELSKLAKKINRQIAARKIRTDQIVKETTLGELVGLEPDDPAHFRDNGTLSERGVEVCYRLFDAGKTPLAVAYMMRVSKRTTLARHKEWKKIGGVKRPTVELPPRHPRKERRSRRRYT
ncbi:hypothetical protein JJB99_03095 [Bradyrhizobium diazoefficiens]|uniref:hypothetical protein n=1 Tax=Bradyrhizobium diazoefficiens TaxID=1355477 RepID=UPI00190D989C|nr:hypothetical protein [Bradyrhizobium diazoefficiens]QQO15190.1 hypothetical protein JJB99_03095 [Bradyrhizobium diazoefficiens]